MEPEPNAWSKALSWIRARVLLWDWIVPLGAVGVVTWRFPGVREYLPTLTDGLRSTIYATLASISAGLLGFVIAGVTILVTMGETLRIKKMIEHGMLDKVIGVFNSAAKWLAVGTVCALVGLVLDRDNRTRFHLYSWVVVAVSTVWVLRMMSCLWVLEQVVALLVADKKKQVQPAKRTAPYIPADPNPRRGID